MSKGIQDIDNFPLDFSDGEPSDEGEKCILEWDKILTKSSVIYEYAHEKYRRAQEKYDRVSFLFTSIVTFTTALLAGSVFGDANDDIVKAMTAITVMSSTLATIVSGYSHLIGLPKTVEILHNHLIDVQNLSAEIFTRKNMPQELRLDAASFTTMNAGRFTKIMKSSPRLKKEDYVEAEKAIK